MRGKPVGLTHLTGWLPSRAAEAALRSAGESVGSGDGLPLGCSLKATVTASAGGVTPAPLGVTRPVSRYEGAAPAVETGERSWTAATATDATMPLSTAATATTASLGRNETSLLMSLAGHGVGGGLGLSGT